MKTLPWRDIARVAWSILAALLLFYVIMAAKSTLTPFIIGLFAAYLLMPIVNRLSRRMPRVAAILLVYGVGLIIFIGLIIFVIPLFISQLQRLIGVLTDFPKIQATGLKWLEEYRRIVPESAQPAVEEAIREWLATVSKDAGKLVEFALKELELAAGFLESLVGYLILPLWLFYLLKDQRRALASLNRILSFHIRDDFWNIWAIIDRAFMAYLRGQVTLAVLLGAGIGIGLTIIDALPAFKIDYILLLILWAALCKMIPMVGGVAGAVPAVLVGFSSGGIATALVIIALFLVIDLLENHFLAPRIIGEKVGVHPAILIVSMLMLGRAFGLPGVIFAAPATAIARDVYLYVHRRLKGMSPEQTVISISNWAEHTAHDYAAQV